MKTLNRTLSLALVFALVFSLMSFAFAADTTTTTTTTAATKLSEFTDASKVTYKEAADYLIAAGIVKGDTATTLNPQGDLTREQAAKMIAYACLGQVAADNLKAGTAPFTDVAADRWSAGYIAYCQKQGIINGLGDGTFDPTAKVTGYQYAKMLLSSIGYGVNGEFTGSGWDLEVAKLAQAYGIFKGNLAGASSSAANREEAFLYTFNTLSSLTSVSYNKSLGIYYVPGAQAIATNPTDSSATRASTVGAVKFGMKRVEGQVGDYGEAAHYWTKNSVKATAKYPDASEKLLASSTNGTTFANLQDSSKSTYIGYAADKDPVVKYFYNGERIYIEATAKANQDYAVGDYILVGSIAAGGDIYKVTTAIDYTTTPIALAGNTTDLGTFAFDGIKGVAVNFYDTDEDSKYDAVDFVQDKVTKLTADAKAVTSGADTLVTVSGITNLSSIKSDNVTGYDGLKKGDYVTYHTNLAADTWTITKCTTVSGSMVAYNTSAGIAMIGATQYKTSGLSYQSSAATTGKTVIDNAYTGLIGLADTTYYLDKGNNIVGYVAGASVANLSNTYYVLDASMSNYAVTAKVLASDGTSSVITIAKIDDSTATSATTGNTDITTAAGTKAIHTFYTFTKNSNGSYNLTSVAAANKVDGTTPTTSTNYTAGNKVFAKSTANFFYTNGTQSAAQGKLATSSTVFVVENPTGTYKAYTGAGNCPQVTAASTTTFASVLLDNDGYVTFAVAVGGTVNATSTSNDYMFVATTPTTFKDANGNYYGYTSCVVNNAPAAVTYATSNAPLVPGAFMAITGYDNGRISTASATDSRIIAMQYNARAFKVNGTTFAAYSDTAATTLLQDYVTASDCTFYVYDVTDYTAPTLKAYTADEIASLSSTYYYEIQGLQTSDSDKTLKQVYITKCPQEVGSDITVAAGTTATAATVTGTITSSAALAEAMATTGTIDASGRYVKFTTTNPYPAEYKNALYSVNTVSHAKTLVGTLATEVAPTTPALYAVSYYSYPLVPTVAYIYVKAA